MSAYLIISIILIVLCLGFVFFGNENIGSKLYRGVSAAAMSLVGVLAFQMINP